MRLIKNALLVILTLIIALCSVFVYELPISAEYLLTEKDYMAEEPTPQEDGDEEEFEAETEMPTETPSEEPSSSESSEPSKESVETSADSSAAAGKIIEQFISPYAAKTSYNNVYIKNSSGLSINIKNELAEKIKFKVKKSSEPQVLIVHTHATECFMNEDRSYYKTTDPSRTTDNSKNVTHIGDIVANKLNEAGFVALHDKTQHDYPSYTGSYSRSLKTINEYLKKYPSIKIVLDIHRDSISQNSTDRVKPVVKVDGKKAAQVMLCMGSQSGGIKNFPNWKENFRLATRFQQTMEVMYPGLARPMMLLSKVYNQNLTTGSMLLEVGTESNHIAEAEYSAELVGNALVALLNTLE